jgi:ubiquitin C-terminal hydrolase
MAYGNQKEGGSPMKIQGNATFNSSKSQVNIASDQATIHASYSQSSQEDLMEKLWIALQKLHEALVNVPNPDKELVKLSATTEDLLEEMKNDEVSKSKLTRFREKIENIHPELQLGSTLLAAISTASDVIQTITNT